MTIGDVELAMGNATVISLKPRIFCAGVNLYMLGASSHGRKVNFCKFTFKRT